MSNLIIKVLYFILNRFDDYNESFKKGFNY